MLKSVNVGVLAALFNFGAVARPDGLGIQVRHGMCPRQGHMVLPPCTFIASLTASFTSFATDILQAFEAAQTLCRLETVKGPC